MDEKRIIAAGRLQWQGGERGGKSERLSCLANLEPVEPLRLTFAEEELLERRREVCEDITRLCMVPPELMSDDQVSALEERLERLRQMTDL